MPVPESYASSRYSGRDERFSTFSSTRSATRPGLISPAYTSKLTSSTLPPRPSFERKSSIESASSGVSRYLSGSRTIPSYGTPSLLRTSASPSRAATTGFRRDVPSVSERIRSYDLTSSGEKEFVSRFLRPTRETSVASGLGTKSNAYLLSRDRSTSRDSGYSSPFVGTSSGYSGIGAHERDRDVRANIAARAASIGPSALTRPGRNGHSSFSQQSSTEVTSKSNASSASSSANASRGATPPKRNQTAPPTFKNHLNSSQGIVGVSEKSGSVGSNRNDAHASKIQNKVPSGRETVGSGDIDNGPSVNENNVKRERSVKMIVEVDSNGNSVTNGHDSPEDTETRSNVDSIRDTGQNDLHCVPITQNLERQDVNPEKQNGAQTAGEHCRSNVSNAVCNGIQTAVAQAESKTASNQNGVTKKGQRRSSGQGPSHLPSKLPASESKQVPSKEEEASSKKPLPALKYAGRQQSASPVRQIVSSKLRTPSPAKLVATPCSRSRESATSISVNRKNSDGNAVPESKSSAQTISSQNSTATAVTVTKGEKSSLAAVPAASREQSLSRSPSPRMPLVPKAPPLPDLYLNGDTETMTIQKTSADENHQSRPGPSTRAAAAQSDSSDNDGDNYTTSPTLGGRFRSSRDKNNDYEKEAGLSGLRNIGNTCFMNSVIQCLSNSKPLLEYIVRKNYTGDINTTTSSMKGALMRAFAELCHELWRDSKSTVDTSAFKDQVQKFAPRFMGYSQQDAQEFLRYLLEGLHEDINRVDTKPPPILTEIDDSLSDSSKAQQSWKRYLRCDDSKIVDLFVGQLKSSLKCTTCGHCSVTFDPFWDLSLPIPSKTGQVKLSQCLELFTKEEILDGDEKPTCSKCGTRRKCTKSFSIQKFPKILVIHLKRFSPTERYRGKLSTTIDFPLTGLDMTPYAAGRSTGCVYNLYGVANHSGSTYSGHYIAYCKHPYTGDWHCYNDSRVSPISSQNVVSSDGYLLFYELAGTSSE